MASNQVQVDIGHELRDILAPIAAREDRSLASLVRLIIRQHLAAEGLRPEPEAAGQKGGTDGN